MTRHRRLASITVWLALFTGSSVARSEIITNHPWTTPPSTLTVDDFSSRRSSFSATDADVASGSQGARVYADLSISALQFPAGADITRFNWSLLVGDTIDSVNNPPGPLLSTSYQVQFWANQNSGGLNQPDSVMYSAELPAASVQTTFKGLLTAIPAGKYGHDWAFYDLSFDLPQSFHIEPDTTYWVSWLAFTPTRSPSYTWTANNGLTGHTWQDFLDVNGDMFGRAAQAGIRHFSLEGTAVPEPGTFAFLAMGAGVLLLVRRRSCVLV